MTTNIPMSEQLREAFPKIEQKTERVKMPPQIEAVLNEGDSVAAGSWVQFNLLPEVRKLRVRNKVDLFNQMRDALRKLSGDPSWSLRYASQIVRENHPFLHSSRNRTIMFDPFMPFRDPIRELSSTRSFLWQVFPSNSYYFKLQQEVIDCQAQVDAVTALHESVGSTTEGTAE